jgi:hypothetical protein
MQVKQGKRYFYGAGKYVCPSDAIMCQDPGHLLCQGQLKDCSGQGDCLKGKCYCHIGWGGPDCSVPICEKGCKDVRPLLLYCSLPKV